MPRSDQTARTYFRCLGQMMNGSNVLNLELSKGKIKRTRKVIKCEIRSLGRTFCSIKKSDQNEHSQPTSS